MGTSWAPHSHRKGDPGDPTDIGKTDQEGSPLDIGYPLDITKMDLQYCKDGPQNEGNRPCHPIRGQGRFRSLPLICLSLVAFSKPICASSGSVCAPHLPVAGISLVFCVLPTFPPSRPLSQKSLGGPPCRLPGRLARLAPPCARHQAFAQRFAYSFCNSST